MVTLKLRDGSKSHDWVRRVCAANRRKLDVAVFGVAHQLIVNDSFHFATKYNLKNNFTSKRKRKKIATKERIKFLANIINIKLI